MESNIGSSRSNSSASADSYIGSLISLTSKSEMRYEGVLYNINTDESSIGLRNVRSFGTEGRKKDGPQVPPSDKVYEYILFRGSDIKDLQVKSSPPAQTLPQPINNDPAIIQSHYPRPASTSAVSGPPTDLGPQNAQFSNFQGGMPMYQPPPPPPNANMGGPWGPSLSPPTAPTGPGGLPMPMYWQGGYNFPPSNGGLPQQSFPRPPSGLTMPPIQYPVFNPSLPIGTSSSSLPGSNLPEIPSSLLPSNLPGSFNMAPASSNLPSSLNLGQSNLPPAPSISLSSETLPNKPSVPILATPPLSANLPPFSSFTVSTTDANIVIPPISNKPNSTSLSTFPYPIMPQQMSSIVGGSNLGPVDTPTPSLVTPGQLLNSTLVGVSTPQTASDKDVEEVVEVSSKTVEPLERVVAESQPPLLPLPQSSRAAPNKPNGAPYQGRPAYRGRERGRGAGFSRPVAKFTEDFDFTAMNEKFNKDEVWGHLGKSNRSHKEGDESSDEDDYEVEDYSEADKVEVKPVYNKDDFFDSISSNALDRESNNGRIRFSEQRKIDTETFGDFSRYQGSRGGHWNGRGGRYRGSYRGRGGYGGGGYAARGGGGDGGGGGYAVRGGGYAVRGGGYPVRGGGGRAMSNRD